MYIARIGSKKICLFVAIVILLIGLSSCCAEERLEQHFGSDDWAYTSLPGKYEIWRMNCSNITLVKKTSDSSGKRIVESYIVEFCYNNSFIGIKQLETNNDSIVIQSPDSAVFSYYLVDVANDLVLGPYSEEKYNLQILELNVGPMCSWISTDTPPEI